MLAVATLGLGSLTLLPLRRPGAVYEVAIVAGFCFWAAGMYFLGRWMTHAERRPWWAMVGGLCLGLAAGCRPHYALAAMLLLALHTGYVLLARRLAWREAAREILYFGGPIVFCGLAIAWYNYARFDSPFELGTKYELTGAQITQISLHSRHILPCLYFYLLSKPVWLNQFPFLQLMKQARAPFGHPEWMPWISLKEAFAGILTIVPLCAAGCLLPPVFLWRVRGTIAHVRMVVAGIWVSPLILLLAICLSGSVGMRYHTDYAPQLLVAALFVCLWAAWRARPGWRRIAIVALTAAGCVWGSACTIALSINGYNHSLRLWNPDEFKALFSIFSGDPASIRYPVRVIRLEGTMAFPQRPASAREALLSAGERHSGDVVFAEYEGYNRLKFGIQHWGAATVLGPEIPYDPEKSYGFVIQYQGDETDLLTVTMDGKTVVSREGEVYYTAPLELSVGHDLTRIEPPLGPFSGRLAVGDRVILTFGE